MSLDCNKELTVYLIVLHGGSLILALGYFLKYFKHFGDPSGVTREFSDL